MGQFTIKNTLLASSMLLGVSILTSTALHAANPAHLEHPHSAGTFMIEYQFMRMNMDGLRDGTDDVSKGLAAAMPSNGGRADYNHMMVPTSMTMDMHMIMPMYNITKELSVMVMGMYMSNKMDMFNRMIPDAKPSMETSGIGDTEVSLSYKFMDDQLAASFGLSIPTGSIEEKVTMKMMPDADPVTVRAPYAMQLGSGTYDITPSLTYLGAYYDLRFGAQGSYTYHIGENDAKYTRGNSIDFQTWIRKAFFGVVFDADLKVRHANEIDGADSKIAQTMAMGAMKAAPTAYPANYGGTTATFGIGAAVPVSIVTVGLKFGIPIYQDLNGLQMKQKWVAGGTLTAMF